MQIHDIRRKNLALLINFAQSIEALGDAMRKAFGDDKNYANWLSQINSGARKMGTTTARKVEKANHLEEGWMDVPQFESPEEAMASLEAMQISRTLSGDALESWMKMGRVLVQNSAPKGAGNPFPKIPKPPPKSGTQ